ncbi:YrhK family protein [Thalassotalea sediminis]|uniref:YrhK family protein n=1 Tax=Thalassotalea sediminis TaxID=1759089 RepID=UPI00257480DC|nr:YrhK family protein [Thalassotalea sediminis]
MTTKIRDRIAINKLGILASLSFFFGSSLFLPTFAEYATTGVWLFMLGSALMFIDIIRP